MATFVPGTGTIKSVTYEAAALEIAQRLQIAENDADPDALSISYLPANTINIAQIAATLPVTFPEGTAGAVEVLADDYITLSGFTAGDSTDLDATTAAGALLEIFSKLQTLEVASTTAPNNIQITFDTEAGTATIAASLPVAFTVATDGTIKVAAVPYL